jgi:hypothetical protein
MTAIRAESASRRLSKPGVTRSIQPREKRAREILERHARENLLHLTVDITELGRKTGD